MHVDTENIHLKEKEQLLIMNQNNKINENVESKEEENLKQ